MATSNRIASTKDSASASRGRRAVVHLAPPRPDADTVMLLRDLLCEAEQGKLTGVVAVTFYRPEASGDDYDMSYSGLAARRPLLAVGAMDVCHMLMRELALKATDKA